MQSSQSWRFNHNLGFLRSRNRVSLHRSSCSLFHSHSIRYSRKLLDLDVQKHGRGVKHSDAVVRAMGEDSLDISLLDDWNNGEGTSREVSYGLSSSDGEDSDEEILVNPVTDVELPSINDRRASSDDALRLTSYRLAMLAKGFRKNRTTFGVVINVGLIIFLNMILLVVDGCAWRIVRLPLPPFYLLRPFSISAVLVSFVGYIFIPLLDNMKIHQVFRKEGPFRHSSKKGTPTMGGLFFVPIGVTVATIVVGFSSVEVFGASAAALAFAAIGFLDDLLSLIKNHNNGLSTWVKILLEVAVGTYFAFWLDKTSISSPYGMKMLVPLPALGLVYLGKYYLLLTSFCFVSMGNGINLADDLDGLAGGAAALSFIGMSIAVLPICPDLSVFGASMAGACVGFLLHNRYKASIFMGNTGSLALGGALAAMAGCTGMFFPLLISSGIFVLEALSVIIQGSYFKSTKYFQGVGRRLLKMAPFHRHLELCGYREPSIVAGLYIISSILALLAGYVGLISA